MKTVIPAVLLALPLLAFARESVAIPIPAPSFADAEVLSPAPIPQLTLGVSELLSVRVEIANSLTNQFEIWFCTDDGATRACRDVLLGIEEGCLFSAGRDAGTELFDSTALPLGDIRLDVTIRSRQSAANATGTVSINGVDNALGNWAVAVSSPMEWRSVRIISRGFADDMPCALIAKSRIGTTIK